MSDILKMGAKHLLTLAPLLLAGCAAGSYCEGSKDYQSAGSVPVVQPADGLQFKESATALKIPPVPESQVPYGERYVNKNGDEAVRCLDQPPELPPPPPKPPKPDEAPPAATPPPPG